MCSKECRICSKATNLISIFEEVDGSPITDQIKSITNVEISEKDNLPKYICVTCIGKVIEFLDFRRTIESQYRIFYRKPNGRVETARKDVNSPHSISYPSNVESRCLDANIMRSNDSIHKTALPERIPSPIQCSECEMVFVHGDDKLLDHMKDIHSVEIDPPKEIKCQYCRRVFFSVEALDTHIDNNTIVKKLVCDVCGKSFDTKRARRKHIKSCTGKEPFACTMCPRSYVTKKSLKRHMLHHWPPKAE